MPTSVSPASSAMPVMTLLARMPVPIASGHAFTCTASPSSACQQHANLVWHNSAALLLWGANVACVRNVDGNDKHLHPLRHSYDSSHKPHSKQLGKPSAALYVSQSAPKHQVKAAAHACPLADGTSSFPNSTRVQLDAWPEEHDADAT